MHESALARAALPTAIRCLGKSLRPYSLGHELWLIRENCSVLRGSVLGLPAAVLICSRAWSQLLSVNSERWLGLDLRLWGWRTRRMDSGAELARFLEYRNAGLLEFEHSEIMDPDRGEIRMPGTPFILRLQQWLMGEPCRLSEAQAWDYPVGLAKMRWQAHGESEGCFQIKNAGEAEFDDYIAEEMDRIKINGEGKP